MSECTLCCDRPTDGLQPASATACPTQSIRFGDLDELQAAPTLGSPPAGEGLEDARLYGRTRTTASAGRACFLLCDEPEVYGLPPDPVVTTRDLPAMWRHAGAAALALAGLVVPAFAAHRR